MKRSIRKWLIGDTVFSEYSKVSFPGHAGDQVWLEYGDHIAEVTFSHWLLCIEPLVFGVWVGKDVQPAGGCYLRMGDAALVELDLVHRIVEEDGALLLLRVRDCRLFQLDAIRRWVIYKRYYSRDGLSYRRFREYVAAYSHARRVRLVSHGTGAGYNLFPMDLLGPVPGSNRYVFGLRHSNRTLRDILSTGKLVVMEAPAAYEEAVYKLGRHHSCSPPPPGSLPFDVGATAGFGYYYPLWVCGYQEIRIVRHHDMGSHMLLWGAVENEVAVNGGDEHSYLIHFLQYLHQRKRR